MKKLLTAVAAIILLASCQKEITFDPNNPAGTGNGSGSGGTGTGGAGTGGSTGSGLLIKAVAVTGTETQTTLYSYDAQSRLETVTTSGTSGGLPTDSYQKYVRDGAGRIVKVLQKLADFGGGASDTARLTYHYPTATTMDPDYSVSVKSLGAGGLSLTTIDSVAFSYSGGKLASYYDYMSTNLFGITTPLSENKWEYTYNASGYVTVMKTLSNTSSGAPLTETYNIAYTYGTLANNNYTSASAMQNFILYNVPNTNSAPVVTKFVANSNATSPPLLVTTTLTFTTTGSKITGGTASIVSTGQPNQNTTYTFYYQ